MLARSVMLARKASWLLRIRPLPAGEDAVQRSGGWLFGSRIAALLLGALTGIAAARLLGPAQFGVYAAGASVVVVATALGSSGLDQLLVSGQITEADFRRGVTSAAALVFVISSVAVALWPNLSTTSRGVGLIVSFAAAMTVLRLPWTVVPGAHLQFSVRAKRELALACCVSVATLSLTAALRSPLSVAAGAASVGLVVALLVDRGQHLRPATGVSSRDLLRKGLPFALSGVLYSLYFALDASLMAALRPAAEVGFYRVAYSFVIVAVAVAVVLNNDIMRPTLARRGVTFANARPFLLTTAALGIAFAAAIYGLAPFAVKLFYGSGFSPAVTPLRILGLSLIPHFFNAWLVNIYVSRGQWRRVLWVQGVLLVVNVGMNLWLIPMRGGEGAALATLITEVLGVALYGYRLKV
jgi:O-antigen/teichoic acid export membrane protein